MKICLSISSHSTVSLCESTSIFLPQYFEVGLIRKYPHIQENMTERLQKIDLESIVTLNVKYCCKTFNMSMNIPLKQYKNVLRSVCLFLS